MTLNFLETDKGNGDKLGNCEMTLIHLPSGLTNRRCYSISRKGMRSNNTGVSKSEGGSNRSSYDIEWS